MLRHSDSQLFYSDSVRKEWKIEVYETGAEFTKDDLLEVTVTENLCSKSDITLGSCEASSLDFKMYDNGYDLKGKQLMVSMIVNGHTLDPIPVGLFKVNEEKYEDDERVKHIKAYDALYEVLEKDVSEWFNNLPSKTLTIKQLRDSFFEYLGIEQEEVDLVNDNTLLEFVISNSGATQRMLEEMNERIEQLRESADSDVIVYDYSVIDLSTYDPSKKTNDDIYTEVTAVGNENPHNLNWYEVATKAKNNHQIGDKFLTADTKVKYYYSNIIEASPSAGANPQALGLYEYKKVNNKKKLVLTEDTTVQSGKKYYTATATQKTYYTKTIDSYFNPSALGWYEYYDGKYYPSRETRDTNLHYYFEQSEHPKPMPEYVEVVPQEGQNPSTEEWYVYNQVTEKYERTEDQTVDPNKKYYQKSDPKNRNASFLEIDTTAYRQANPAEEHWYEFDNDAYFRTEDQTVTAGKKYYLNIWDLNQNDRSETIHDEIKGAEILQAICEINGCFGHIGRYGVFRYVYLKPIDYSDQGLYPDRELFPDANLYPAGQPYDQLLTRNEIEEFERESYKVKKIDRLVICKEDGDAGYVYPTGSHSENHNTYKITGNFIWYSFTGEQSVLDTVGLNVLTYGIGQISEYTPCTVTCMGNPCIEVGDTLKISTRLGDTYMYVMSRTLKDDGRLTDEYEAQGDEEREDESSIYNAIIELRGRSNVFTRNVDETRSEIIDVSEGLTSLIKQTAESIQLSIAREVKNAEDNGTEKYKSAIEYTDRLISQTVSKTVFDEQQKEIEEYQSNLSIEYDQISAEVSHTVKDTGEGDGFKWTLLSTGFILESKGGYLPVNIGATDSMTAVTPQAGDNPANEWWHERVNGAYVLTTDTTVVSGKTYYKSTQNPHDANWYEINNGYVLTPDTCIHEYKTYWRRDDSQEYRPVFTCNSQGVKVDGVIKSSDLDVANLATFGMVRAIDIDVKTLNVQQTATVRDLRALQSVVTNQVIAKMITTDNLGAIEINANQITGGTINASRIDTNGIMSGKTLTCAHLTASQGLVSNGHTITETLHINHPYISMDDDDNNTSYRLQVMTTSVKTPSGATKIIHYLGYPDNNN